MEIFCTAEHLDSYFSSVCSVEMRTHLKAFLHFGAMAEERVNLCVFHFLHFLSLLPTALQLPRERSKVKMTRFSRATHKQQADANQQAIFHAV